MNFEKTDGKQFINSFHVKVHPKTLKKHKQDFLLHASDLNAEPYTRVTTCIKLSSCAQAKALAKET